MVVKHNGAADMPINALAIGLALFVAIRESSGISGGCINPAVGLVQSILQSVINKQVYPNADKTNLKYAGVYVASTLAGGFFAGIFHKWFHERAIASAQNAKDSEYENMVNNWIRINILNSLEVEDIINVEDIFSKTFLNDFQSLFQTVL